jgi:hypothetical protein
MRVEFSPADGPKPDSLALRPALVDLGPASRSIRQFGLEDQMPFDQGCRKLRVVCGSRELKSRRRLTQEILSANHCTSPWYATSADATTQELDICSKPKVQK